MGANNSNGLWIFRMDKRAAKAFAELDFETRDRILLFIEERILPHQNPRLLGKPLTGKWKGYYSYRIGDYRVIADIQDHLLTVFAVEIAHRRVVYDL